MMIAVMFPVILHILPDTADDAESLSPESTRE
jgi:hypothetical protein